ncbi:MAG: ArnT family glycosyltransferase [Gemmobacter sp.]|uniref:ArnT family glycosyltransferase n=1 Tax=Gemmobacter sp. TaxID=1898957 RepID=UPI00391D5416
MTNLFARAASGIAGWLLLAGFALLAFLSGLSTLPVTDRDEARFVQASRQMVQSGDPIDIRFQDQARHAKPVGIYWLQSAAVLGSGFGEQAPLWVYRLPSLAGAVLSVLLVAAVGLPLFGRTPALLAAAVFAGGLVIAGEARIAKTDAVLLATVLAAQAVLARVYMGQAVGRAGAYGFWLAIAAGLLIKGPIGPIVPALTVVALGLADRRLGWLRPILSPGPILLALALVLPWVVAISLRTGGAFWAGSVGADLLPKIAAGQEGKGAPPGTYLALVWLTAWPVGPLLLLALPAVWHARGSAPVRFCLAWAVPLWLLYEAVPTKLIHYPLPAFPALALLAVAHLPAYPALVPRGILAVAGLAVLPGLLLGMAVLAHALDTGQDPAALHAAPGLASGMLLAGLAIRAFALGQGPASVAICAALAGAGLHSGLVTAAARMPALWPSEAALARVRDLAPADICPRPQLTGWGYTEPSLVWLGGRETRLLPATAAEAEAIRPGPCAFVMKARQEAANLPEPASGCRPAGSVTGLAIGAGRRVTLDILDCCPQP